MKEQTSPFITVRFSAIEEFLEELTPNAGRGIDCIEQVIRVTKVFTQSQTLPITHVSVIAAMLRDVPPTVQQLKLLRPCGELLGEANSMSDATMKRAEAIQKEIEAFAKKWGLEVRAGIYE